MEFGTKFQNPDFLKQQKVSIHSAKSTEQIFIKFSEIVKSDPKKVYKKFYGFLTLRFQETDQNMKKSMKNMIL